MHKYIGDGSSTFASAQFGEIAHVNDEIARAGEDAEVKVEVGLRFQV
jgi:hypothetical protein